jgi:hypothetical protein
VDPPGQSALAEHRFDRPGELELERQPAPQRAPRPGRRPSATPVAHDITTPHNALTRHNTRRASEPNTRNPYRTHLEPGVATAGGVAGGRALDNESFDSHGCREYLEPLPGLIDVRGDWRQLKRRCINRISLRG